eukprot:scaffold133488_cov39-Cyclotella_meneghiniana.AAC.8
MEDENWVPDDNGFLSLMPYKDLPSETKAILGHSHYYVRKTKAGQPTAVCVHANLTYASSWYCNHWSRELCRYFKEDSSRYQVANRLTGVFFLKCGVFHTTFNFVIGLARTSHKV